MQNSAAANTPFTGDSRMRSALGTMLLAVCALPTVIAAQNPVSNGIRALAQRQTKNIVDAAEEMPADKYGYKPTPAQMTYGDVVAHLIKEGNNYLCSAASGIKQPDADKFTVAYPGNGRRKKSCDRVIAPWKMFPPVSPKRRSRSSGESTCRSITARLKLGAYSLRMSKQRSANWSFTASQVVSRS